MSAKVRVFISSTMEDLANEREFVAEQIRDIGLEPVNAEGLLPNGSTSWDLLADEIRNSHIFVLLMGDRYGWIPASSAGTQWDKSVTHLETDLAKASSLPILPFVKRLRYGTDSTSDDAIRRDKFRRQIEAWEDGQFRAEFDRAMDLGHKVRQALLGVFQDTYLKRAVRRIDSTNRSSTEFAPKAPATSSSAVDNFVAEILFAGAGFSISAGYPTASSLAEVLGKRLGLVLSGPEILARHSFVEVASFAERRIGRAGLLAVIRELLDTPIPVEPTPAHFQAVQSFSTILTTNYDLLFERACVMLGREYAVATPHRPLPDPAPLMIYKIDGSIDAPDTLVLTHEDAAAAAASPFWQSVNELMQARGVVVIGHSIRDITSQRILSARNLTLPGMYVSPHLDELDTIRLQTYGLKGIVDTANGFLVPSKRS